MTQTPAAWFPDPEDPTQYRYWDGTAWTEHRSPRKSPTGDQLSQAGKDLADGLSKGFTAVGGWLNQNVPMPGQHTFASVAAACQDEPPREPLSHSVELVHAPTDLPGLLPLFAGSSVALTPEGGTSSCRAGSCPTRGTRGTRPAWRSWSVRRPSAASRPPTPRRTARRSRPWPRASCSPPGPCRSGRPGSGQVQTARGTARIAEARRTLA